MNISHSASDTPFYLVIYGRRSGCWCSSWKPAVDPDEKAAGASQLKLLCRLSQPGARSRWASSRRKMPNLEGGKMLENDKRGWGRTIVVHSREGCQSSSKILFFKDFFKIIFDGNTAIEINFSAHKAGILVYHLMVATIQSRVVVCWCSRGIT